MKEKDKSIIDFPESYIQKILADRPAGSKMKLMQNGELVQNITLNMACFTFRVSDSNHNNNNDNSD